MTPELQSDSLEQQRALWQQLADAIEQAQQALLRGNLVELERWTGQQQQCCERLAVMNRTPIASEEPSSAADAILKDIDQMRRKVHHRNQIHAALLDRARRSLRTLRHLLGGGQEPYTPPAEMQQPAPAAGRG